MVSRFTTSRHIARNHEVRGATGGEPICRVRCVACSACSLLRLDLRGTAALGAKVFWIPGLTYDYTVEDGVGLVLHEGRIVGRMLCGTTSCGCRVPETVKIK